MPKAQRGAAAGPAKRPRHRLLLVGRSGYRPGLILFEAFLRAARSRQDVEIVAICDGDPTANLPQPLYALRAVVAWLLTWLFNPWLRATLALPQLRNQSGLARVHRVPLIVPPERNVNHPAFVERLQAELRPTLTLVCAAPVFREPLRAALGYTVNYHDALLPDYKGVWATAWSLYRGATHTGYTFHTIEQALDAGPILLQRSIPVTQDARHDALCHQKARMAAADAAALLDLMAAGAVGTPQRGVGSMYTRADTRGVRRIDDPGAITADELRRRLWAFDSVQLRFGDAFHEVTAVRPVRRAGQRYSFTTRDGQRLVAHRCSHLPVPLYRLLRGLLSRRPRRTARG